MLITKGDLFDQERKLATSGLGAYFGAVEIVSDRSTGTYRRVFDRHGDDGRHSLKSGCRRSPVFMSRAPWVVEHAEKPVGEPHFRQARGWANPAPAAKNRGEPDERTRSPSRDLECPGNSPFSFSQGQWIGNGRNMVNER